jgi:hypothetical protein
LIITIGKIQFGWRLKPKPVKQKLSRLPPSVDQMRMMVYSTKGCSHGTCKTCHQVCAINRYKQVIGERRPPFCPGDKKLCPRSKLQACGDCRTTHLDYNIVSDYVEQPFIQTVQHESTPMVDCDELEKLVIP